MQSLRRTLLEVIARVLRRWLGYVTAQLEPAVVREMPAPPEAEYDVPVPRQPPPPDHWVELVRQHAPQLLEPDAASAADSSGASEPSVVIDWRSEALPLKPPKRPARLLAAQNPAPAKPPTVKTSLKRPLRLEQVRAQTPGVQEINTHAADFDAAEVEPPSVRTSARPVDHSRRESPSGETSSLLPPLRPTRQADQPALQPSITQAVEADAPPVRQIPTQHETAEPLARRFAELPVEQHVRETNTSVPEGARIPTIRTGAGGSVQPTQRRTSVPGAPAQVVYRPTILAAPLNAEDITADRWPSLPNEPAEAPRDADSERQRRERLKREQEGRAWSE